MMRDDAHSGNFLGLKKTSFSTFMALRTTKRYRGPWCNIKLKMCVYICELELIRILQRMALQATCRLAKIGKSYCKAVPDW